jgi:hypothetical protein
MNGVQAFKDNPKTGEMTATERKQIIVHAHKVADEAYFADRALSDQELKVRALTKVVAMAIADEPWGEDWIRRPDVERKLSRFEMHRPTVDLAQEHGFRSPKEAISAARKALLEAKQAEPKDGPVNRGPWDDIEVIFVPGTVSSTATSKIDRSSIYPISVASVANCLQTHICRDVTTPFAKAESIIKMTDTSELLEMRRWACDVCDFAPHFLDNDNISLLLVLLILPRSEVVKRFEANGIRIEGSTISHRRSECMRSKLNWRDPEDRKPFDNTATDFQTRIKNAHIPPLRPARVPRPKAARNSSSSHASTPAFGTPGHGTPMLATPTIPSPRLPTHAHRRSGPPIGFYQATPPRDSSRSQWSPTYTMGRPPSSASQGSPRAPQGFTAVNGQGSCPQPPQQQRGDSADTTDGMDLE